MFDTPFLDGWFHSLGTEDRSALAAHWARLDEDCLRRRFLRPMRPADLAAQAEAAIAPGAEVIGWFRRGVLRGAAELHHETSPAEAAFSVESEYRSRGIGQALMDHVLRRARNRGCLRVMVMTTRDNRPMIRIAEKAGARFEFEGREVFGFIDLERPNLVTRMADLGEEETSLAAEIVGRMERMAAAWLPGRRRPGPR